MTDRCGACGKAFVEDDEWPGLFERACECMRCTYCGEDFKPDDDQGPQIAKTDELSAKYGDHGRCDACWTEVIDAEIQEIGIRKRRTKCEVGFYSYVVYGRTYWIGRDGDNPKLWEVSIERPRAGGGVDRIVGSDATPAGMFDSLANAEYNLAHHIVYHVNPKEK
jgi:hypothetical protein